MSNRIAARILPNLALLHELEENAPRFAKQYRKRASGAEPNISADRPRVSRIRAFEEASPRRVTADHRNDAERNHAEQLGRSRWTHDRSPEHAKVTDRRRRRSGRRVREECYRATLTSVNVANRGRCSGYSLAARSCAPFRFSRPRRKILARGEADARECKSRDLSSAIRPRRSHLLTSTGILVPSSAKIRN